MSSTLQIIVEDLTVCYNKCQVLSNISGCFYPGSMNAIVGPNGGGKSTFLKTILNLVAPTSGRITCRAKKLGCLDIAYLPQQAEIDRQFPITVHEVTALGLCHKYGFLGHLEDQQARVQDALKTVSMQAYINHEIRLLSGGQFQRMLFARLSLQNSQILLLDEPFIGVDYHTIEDLMKILVNWSKQGKIVIMISHDSDLVKKYFTNTIILARQCFGWGRTKEVFTEDNLKKARNSAASRVIEPRQ